MCTYDALLRATWVLTRGVPRSLWASSSGCRTRGAGKQDTGTRARTGRS